jgi:AcrR family transcriptional regulator
MLLVMSAKPRTRLSRPARRRQLLETAKKMIVEEGLQNFSMEALARWAGVSSPLVYNYFDTRQALLQELLETEYQAFVSSIADQISASDTFEEVVRIFIASNFDHYAPGNILPILRSQPELSVAIQSTETERNRQTARFLVQNTAREYQLSKAKAELVVRMSSGASIAAAEHGTRTGADRDETIDTVLAYVLAGFLEISKHDK